MPRFGRKPKVKASRVVTHPIGLTVAIDRDVRNIRSHIIVEFEQSLKAFHTLDKKVSWLEPTKRFNEAFEVMCMVGLEQVCYAIVQAEQPLPRGLSLIPYADPKV